MQSAFQPQIILLREGTDTSQGKAQIISNINACQAVAETVKTTLGPRGMDKLVFDGQRTTISNDGATIMRVLDIVHPAAKTLVDISMAQVSAHIILKKQYKYIIFLLCGKKYCLKYLFHFYFSTMLSISLMIPLNLLLFVTHIIIQVYCYFILCYFILIVFIIACRTPR
jgi:hypothetical protein